MMIARWTYPAAHALAVAGMLCATACGTAAVTPVPAGAPSAAATAVKAAPAGQGCDPRSNGATGDGHTLDTVAIQKTLTACPGQVVQLSTGTYVSGPLFIPTGTTFSILPGATLRATDDAKAFHGGSSALITSDDGKNVTLNGGGVVDGAGSGWWERFRAAQRANKPAEDRPRLVAFNRCQHARIENLTFQNSPSFHLVLRSCSDVDITHVTIKAPPDSPNTDGIDPMSSHDVRISDSTIDDGDDNIAIKSGTEDPANPGAGTSRITITNCTFLNGHGVSVGSETNGGVQDVVVADSSFRGTQNGIRIKTGRGNGGPISNVTYRNLTMDSVKVAISFASYYPKIPATDTAQPVTSRTPSVSNVVINGLTAKGSSSAGEIVGLPEQPYHDIQLQNVSIVAASGIMVRNATISAAGTTITTAGGPPFNVQDDARVETA